MIVHDSDLTIFQKYLSEVIKSSLYKNNAKSECPHCNSKNRIRYGRYHGIQRYKCKECGKTFSNTTGSVWYYSKKSPLDWIQYIELMFEKRTLKSCANILGMNIATAFYWRQKILRSLSKTRKNQVLRDFVYMRKIVFKENFKGDKEAKKEERQNIWVVAASDTEKNIISAPVCRKDWKIDKFNKEIYSKIDKNCIIHRATDRYLNNIASKHNNGPVDDSIEDKYFMEGYVREVQKTMEKFCGVATKYLNGYLYWISLFRVGELFNNLSLFNKLLTEEAYVKCKLIKEIKLEF